jgi:hypothetical protein
VASQYIPGNDIASAIAKSFSGGGKGVFIGVLVHSEFLQGYLDESGTHEGSAIVCSGGYLFEPEGADRFREAWEPYLDSKGLEYFHANECFRRPDWDEIFDELVSLILKTAHIGFVKCVQNEIVSQFEPKVRHHLGSPFTMCTIGCMELMSLAAQGENKQVLYFIEEGNEFAGELPSLLKFDKRQSKTKSWLCDGWCRYLQKGKSYSVAGCRFAFLGISKIVP